MKLKALFSNRLRGSINIYRYDERSSITKQMITRAIAVI